MVADSSTLSGLEKFKVAFVCTGNRARSPLAEAFLTKLVEPGRVTVISRGTQVMQPHPALPDAVSAGARLGVDLDGHMSTTMVRGEFADTDLVVGFEPFHLAAAVIDGGAPRARAFTIIELGEILERLDRDGFLRSEHGPSSVVLTADGARRTTVLSAPSLADPLGASPKEFRRVAGKIEELVTTMARTIFPS
jgi:protein-tyrosine-phosphatase